MSRRIVGGGKETLRTCPKCGREKLYENRETGLFFCQRCQHKGKKGERDLAPKEPLPQIDQLQLELTGLLSGAPVVSNESVLRGTGLPEGFRPFFDGGWSVPAHLRGFMKQRGLLRDDLLDWGLGTTLVGPMRGRLVFPVVTKGEVTYQARLVSGDGPKYLNPAGTKGAFIYGFDRVAMRDGPVIICEGVFDVIAVWRAGGTAVGLMGKSCTQTQKDMLSSLKRELIICLDADAHKDSLKLSRELGHSNICSLPHGDDPDTFLSRHTYDELVQHCK